MLLVQTGVQHLVFLLRWMEACLGEELPAPTELEEALRNGVVLAKLGHRFAPTAVPLKKIYDPDQQRYQVTEPSVNQGNRFKTV